MIDDARQVTERLGLGTFKPSDEAPHEGRNENITGTTSSGHDVFVKKLKGDHAAHRLQKLISFEQTCRRHLPPALRTPECLGWEEANEIIVFQWLRHAESGLSLAASDAFSGGLARRCGTLLGAVHTAPGDRSATPPPQPERPDLFKALPLHYYERASGAVLEFWSVLHRDGVATSCLTSLREASTRAPHTLIHADLRLDQFLIDSTGPLLCDWEEWDMGDPARDVGAFAGEWLYRAVRSIPTRPEGGLRTVDQDRSPRTRVLGRGLSGLAEARTKTVAFWNGYTAATGIPADGLAERATAYAGWHLLERVLATAECRSQLSTLDRMTLGIGSTALRSPWKFAGVLGLGSHS
ncbi:hypothetical protein BKI49_09960 [Streptomyces sp. Tue6028]|uniref:class V lanthionine synthetase subunit LxmK n=1 Tax=Streptomyces sp. Tue6028 TaxID=2036037 RepID=UPI000BCED7CE|nr:class V lanthionine synthetase subunit LxmK [Streptomyces sp. Tue6028]PBC64021.1 hypothetical protein BKI49_09960 [Streptomyces sp. Tue6028]